MKIIMRTVPGIIAMIAVLWLPAVATAQSSSAEGRAGHWYIGGGFGGFSEESNSQLSNQDGEFATFFSGGYRASPYVAVEGDAMYWKQDFSTPSSISSGILSIAEARTDLRTTGIGGVIKLYLPLEMVDLYAGAGLGLYTSNLHVTGTQGSIVSTIDENDTNVGYQVQLGADVYVSHKISVGLEYRWLKVDSNFEPYIVNDLDVGGQYFFATVRGHF